MKIDLYTKGILTIIALSLVVIAFKDIRIVKEAFAGFEMTVGVCHAYAPLCVDIVQTGEGEAMLVKIVD
jgi:hypothetical protein